MVLEHETKDGTKDQARLRPRMWFRRTGATYQCWWWYYYYSSQSHRNRCSAGCSAQSRTTSLQLGFNSMRELITTCTAESRTTTGQKCSAKASRAAKEGSRMSAQRVDKNSRVSAEERGSESNIQTCNSLRGKDWKSGKCSERGRLC